MTESGQTFREAVLARIKDGADERRAEWLQYTLATNERGAQVVAKVREFVPSLRGRRLLDVGSGCGGLCIEAARAGADAVGVEVNDTLRGLAVLNLADFPGLSVTFSDADVMDWSRLAPLGRFDVITCENVIEHVASPPVLLAHARRLLQRDGLLYLTVPNAFSFGQIMKECHYGQFGLSLLDPIDGTDWVKEVLNVWMYDVSVYLPLAEYESLLARYGLYATMLNPLAPAEEVIAQVRAARDQVQQARATAAVPAAFRAKVDRLLDVQVNRCAADLAFVDAMTRRRDRETFARRLKRLYLDELWYFVASPDARRVAGSDLAARARALGGEVLASLQRRWATTK